MTKTNIKFCRNGLANLHVWTHGGSTVSEQTAPDAMIPAAQHWLASTPGMVPHPSPPHMSPHSSGQHTSVLGSCTPVWPLLHTESAGAGSGNAPKRHEKKASTVRVWTEIVWGGQLAGCAVMLLVATRQDSHNTSYVSLVIAPRLTDNKDYVRQV